MVDWLHDFGALTVAWICVQVLLACMLGMWAGWHGWQRRLGAFVLRVASPPSGPVVPRRRPIEETASDLRRLRTAFGTDGVRFAKWEGIRRAYDGVLAEAADTCEIPHHMDLLSPGVDRDRERARIERLLEDAGLLPRIAA